MRFPLYMDFGMYRERIVRIASEVCCVLGAAPWSSVAGWTFANYSMLLLALAELHCALSLAVCH